MCCLEGLISTGLRPALIDLLAVLNPNLLSVDVGLSKILPMLVLAFDEAHTLSLPKTTKG